ncbi:MAG: hypothetical protein FLDDKLPJ_02358 [Phycisphaerae bacterium]|nr:hypothetical protein [Phycisphaerae bacterium]
MSPPRVAPVAGDPSATVDEPCLAEVVDVEGRADRAALGARAASDEGWTPLVAGDRLAGGTLIRTGLRSRLVLRFGEANYVSIERATLACVNEFRRSGDVERIDVGLGYGAVRGASSTGTLRSELTVTSPVATLAKEGTRDWEIRVEPHTGRFTISLATEGLVNAIQRLRTGRTQERLVLPGEYATQDNIARMWMRQATFDRAFSFYDVRGLSDADLGFVIAHPSGASPVAPGGGTEIRAIALRDTAAGATRADRPAAVTAVLRNRPEGNFGIAQAGSSE